ncbi:hypothetical protein [Actinophytocola sp.]|uniref:hypothetical protein n=1 Tax=Actinophytocola sp. TaxID=1872138 RepID=UPI002ECFB803
MAAADAVPSTITLGEGIEAALVDLVVRGMSRGDPSPEVRALAESGLALLKGPLAMPTPRGTQLAGDVLRLPPGSDVERQVRSLYEAFLPVNHRLRDVCTGWQCHPDGRPNDHSDDAYDAGVRDELDDVHDAVSPILRRLATALPRCAGYLPRLEDALDRLDDGDHSWLASPVIDSYHTVWMHLHQELLLALGVSRSEDADLEQRLVVARAAG